MQRYSRLALGGAVLALAGLASGAPDAPPPGKANLRDVSYEGLGKLVRSHKGKVVVIDFWGVY